MLHLGFFGVFKRVPKHLEKDPSRPVTEDHGIRIFKACGSAGASSTTLASLIHAGFIYVRGADGGYTLALDEAKVRRAAEFREVWDMDSALGELSGWRTSRRGFLNEEVFIGQMRS
jgi:hypothetical protein